MSVWANDAHEYFVGLRFFELDGLDSERCALVLRDGCPDFHNDR